MNSGHLFLFNGFLTLFFGRCGTVNKQRPVNKAVVNASSVFHGFINGFKLRSACGYSHFHNDLLTGLCIPLAASASARAGRFSSSHSACTGVGSPFYLTVFSVQQNAGRMECESESDCSRNVAKRSYRVKRAFCLQKFAQIHNQDDQTMKTLFEKHQESYQLIPVQLRSRSMMICYECLGETNWLAPDGRCGKCTHYSPEEIQGLQSLAVGSHEPQGEEISRVADLSPELSFSSQLNKSQRLDLKRVKTHKKI